ncbi:MAG: SRPBCC family protein [Solirubrobacterales bacterium]
MAEAVEESARIPAPPEDVYDLLMDPDQLGTWVSAHREVLDMPELPLAEGEEFGQKLGVGPVRFKVRWTVEEARRPSYARWSGKGPGGSEAEVTYELSEEGGGTRFDYTNEYKLPGGLLGKAAKGAVSSAAGSREARKSLKRLREHFERH